GEGGTLGRRACPGGTGSRPSGRRPDGRHRDERRPRGRHPGVTASGMRIAIFVSEFPALSETFVMRQVVGLLERGHDVTVFADRPRAETLTHPDFDRYDLRRRTRYLGMPAGRARRLLT